MFVHYPLDLERAMQQVFHSLGEHDRRIYAAIEAAKLGHGGIGYIAGLFGSDCKTIRRRLQELAQPAAIASGFPKKRGGQKSCLTLFPAPMRDSASYNQGGHGDHGWKN